MNGKCESLPFVLDGNAWYNQQAYRALNQALGRCIRHKYDYGCIIFLESRFYGTTAYSQKNVSNLSKWVRPYIKSSMSVNSAIRDLIRPYFEYMNKNPPRRTKFGEMKWTAPFCSDYQRLNSSLNNVSNNRMNNKSVSPPIGDIKYRNLRSNVNLKNNIGGNRQFSFNNGSQSVLSQNGMQSNRKRKFEAIENENFDPVNATNGSLKKMKLQRIVTSKPNCIQCAKCSALALRGTFESVSLPGPGGMTKEFYLSTNEHRFPRDTANDCIWSSQLGLCCLEKCCSACNGKLGFHVVGASTENKLKYYKRILFLASTTRLHTIP